jgi:signal transduction histidine kinase
MSDRQTQDQPTDGSPPAGDPRRAGASAAEGDGGRRRGGLPRDGDLAGLREQVRVRQLARLGALFAGFAHEIRNPLSTIGLNLQLVKEDLGGAAEARDLRVLRRLTVVESEVQRLQGILEQFLAFVRIPELRTEPVDLDAMLREVVEFHQPEFGGRGISLRYFGDPSLGPVPLDRDQFRAVLVNLLRNAADACRSGDEVMVSARPQGEFVAVAVTDTGPGMSAQVRESAFAPYFSTKKQGTGLGLPTARRIVEQHGGEMLLDSEPGRGTMFTIRLPRTGAPAASGGDPA